MSDNKILSFEEFINQGEAGSADVSMETPEIDSTSDNLPVPAQEVTGEEPEHNVPNNMIEEPAEGEAPNADVEIEASDDVDQHID